MPAPSLGEALATANASLRARNEERDDRWIASPFRWIRELGSSGRGAVGEQLVIALLRSLQMQVEARTPGNDCSCNGVRTEIKLSTLWESGHYRFQQLRGQDYEVVALLGLSPQRWHLWTVPKQRAWDHARAQHGGASGADTRWLAVDPCAPPAWLRRYGGSGEEEEEEVLGALRVAYGRAPFIHADVVESVDTPG